MSDPVVVPCPEGVWTIVADAVLSGVVHIISLKPDAYLQTYRDDGQAAPTDLDDAVPFDTPLQISNSTAIDVYVWCSGAAGSVRVDL